MVDIEFDDYITNPEDKIALISILDQTKMLIDSKGLELSITLLDDFESRKVNDYYKKPWAYPIKTQSLITTIDIIIHMLNGTWTSNNYSVYYSGFPNPMNMPEI